MKESIRQRLQKLSDRFEEVGRLLATDEVAGGSQQFRELSMEYARLQPLAERFGRYHGLERDLAAARDLQADPDAGMRTLGEEEVGDVQRELEADPKYAALFEPIAKLSAPLSVDALGQQTVELMRRAANADLALSTVSSFRQPLAPGTVTLEALHAAMPYENEVLVAEMSGTEVQALLALAESKRGSDSYAYIAKPATIDPARSYRVATTDFMGRVAGGYRELFKDAKGTGVKVREEVRRWLASQ